ncbi:fumarylacetoacetate hydrolase family protein [Solidesulfovibrio magneticus]|uniref:Fumarylacetoacetate hydrolase family protein n=1 Tax=Solidesulfovibrio magneticus (strain ATCC 700980 / DSM 13731 / RS-1) TaxID=573370 RepID=C4XQS4_SOLM1|nr:fumarylacetoacetate hydrolase family protein [Solidesulfovibrio magneticus]BAH77808.1 fumarylacetoacetate hydrolase family protein [Solidesulfovibrio magneticus RS-1]
MRLVSFAQNDGPRLGVRLGDVLIDLSQLDDSLPRDMIAFLAGGQEAFDAVRTAADNAPPAAQMRFSSAKLLPVVPRPGKIICVGLNYVDHAVEISPRNLPDHPTFFARLASTLVAHNEPLLRPMVSTKLDFEGELAVIIGKPGRLIPKNQALAHVGGYALFNEGSVRDYQFRTSQWFLGKNFDGTGAFGPELCTPDELPPGASGLLLCTRVNGELVQEATTTDMLFPVPALIAALSEAMTLQPGDVIVTGTPSGVGFARKPPRYLKPGDVCEIELESYGVLRNPVADALGE